jgi:vancomycin resistance protein YoaR
LEEKFTLDIAPELQMLGIKEVVSIGHTSYYSSPQNRMHNIRIGLKKFNGVVITPGETFSFVKQLGPVDGSRGFLKELVIKPEGTLPDFGGGLCQVSTTAYRAALYAGLPIAERSPHSYAVSYYSQIGGHGIDATIYPGARDLKFTNNTPGSLLIQAYDEGPEAYFILYGTNDGREVKLEGPVISNRHSEKGTTYIKTTEIPIGSTRQTKHAQAGFNTLWYRYLTLPGGLTQREEITSRYVATLNEFLVGVRKEDIDNKEVSAEKLFFQKSSASKN